MRTLLLSILLGLIALASPSCGGQPRDNKETGPTEARDKTHYPARIVSMAPSLTEIVFALGLGDRVVGVSDFCDYPPEALEKPKVGAVVNPNMEAIVALNPDLVLALPNATHESLFRSLRQLGINVLTIPNDRLEDLFTTIHAIGEETSTRQAAQEMADRLQAKFTAIREKMAGRPRRKVMFVVGIDPLFVAGKGTFINELITIAGGTNIAGDSLARYPQLGIEQVVSKAPEVILYTSLNFDLTPEQILAAKKLWSPYPSVPAVKDDRIHGLVADHVTLSGPRLVIGIEEMARAIHPEAFEDEEQPS
jgi:iron complex transport system substrate-binding protein